MSEETKIEIAKAFAIGYTAEEVAEMEGLSVEGAAAFQVSHADEINDQKAVLKKKGWL